MKIIDNKKDYYDYISGIIGIDPDVVYDRRNSVRLVNIGKPGDLLPSDYTEYGNSFARTCFSTEKDSYHDFYSLKYHNDPKKYIRKNQSKDYYWSVTYNVGVEAGWYLYVFRLTKILENENSDKFILKPEFLAKNRIYNKFSEAPLVFGQCKTTEYIGWLSQRIDPKHIISFIADQTNGKYDTDNIVKNPILANTWIPKFIKPEEIWNDIYDYLISQKDKVIIDNRSDILHLEAAGFDKKTSFRNVK